MSWSMPQATMSADPGVHLPFTAPLLAGARVRRRDGVIDYILPNPSGGRGTYVAPWAMASELTAPTMHDILLVQRLQELPLLTPAAIRRVARAVAAEGYAGRAAAENAGRAQAAIDAERLRLWSSLLLALIRRSDMPVQEHARALAALGDAGPGRVTDGFVDLARRLGWEPATLSEALHQVSEAFVPLVPRGRARRLLARLETLHAGLLDEQAQQACGTTTSLAKPERAVSRTEHCIARTRMLLEAATTLLADPAILLEQWRGVPADALVAADAVETVLDGWDRICMLWLDAASLSDRICVLPDIVLLATLAGPPATQDLPGSSRGATEAAAAQPQAPPRPLPELVRSLSLAPLVERNERARAREIVLDYGDE